ncbi:hypothetical protein [Micromonospora humi]|uniref:DUF11 domain-containing protein n=1 Tax=Micromonospora humi TaxID=745366 RepID=A0A1C5J705_9ACTN|nr:hypothetical protein [Micromonospora humi]SCG66293.1 hypothetical protein GA0070213_109110 [Micromonospora humi]
MPEPRETRLSGAFEAYRTLTLDAVVPAGPDAVRRTVRRRQRRRVATVAVVVAVAVAAPVAAWAALGRQSTPAPVTSPAPTASPAPTGSPSAGPSASPSTPAGRIERAELLAATVDLPAWPAGAGCRTRGVRLVERTGGDVLLSNAAYAYGDVDGDGVPEPVAVVRCLRGGSPYPEQVVAFDRAADGTPVALGRVFRSDPRRPEWLVAFDARPDGAVRVDVTDRVEADDTEPNAAHRQTRIYRWRDGRFTQTGGPTAFPAEPSPPAPTTSTSKPIPVSPLFTLTTTPVVYGPPDADGWRRGMTTVTVTNVGPDRLTDVRVTLPDSDPDIHEHSLVDGCPTASGGGGAFYCHPGPLDPGERITVGLHFMRRTAGSDHQIPVSVERGDDNAAVPGTTTRGSITVTFE